MATINSNFLKLKAGYLFPEIARHFLSTEDRQLQLFKVARQKENPEISDEDLQKSVDEFAMRLIPWVDRIILERTYNLVGGLTKDNFPEIYPKEEKKEEPKDDSSPVAVEAEVEVEKPIRRVSPETKGIRIEG